MLLNTYGFVLENSRRAFFWDSLEILAVTIGFCIKSINHFVIVELCLIPDALIPDIC